MRQKNDVSQEFLAKKIGVSRPTYVQIEKGSRKMLVEEAQKLASFFSLSLEDFLASKEVSAPVVKLEKSKKIVKSMLFFHYQALSKLIFFNEEPFVKMQYSLSIDVTAGI